MATPALPVEVHWPACRSRPPAADEYNAALATRAPLTAAGDLPIGSLTASATVPVGSLSDSAGPGLHGVVRFPLGECLIFASESGCRVMRLDTSFARPCWR